MRVRFTSLFACLMSFLLREELPHVRGAGSARPTFFKHLIKLIDKYRTCVHVRVRSLYMWYALYVMFIIGKDLNLVMLK